MKRKLIISLPILFIWLISPLCCLGETNSEDALKIKITLPTENQPGQPGQGEVNKWKIGLGLHTTYFRMQQNRGEIFRNITLLDEEQDVPPIKPMIEVSFLKYWAFELGYDKFKAAALNRAFDIYEEHDRRWTDGYVEWTPIMLTLQFRWPYFHRLITPYILGGFSYVKTDWKRNDWYYYGFPSQEVYANWVSQGSRPEEYPNYGYRRIFATDDHSIGTLLGVGVDFLFKKKWAVNLDWRYHWAKVNFTYTLAFDEGQSVVSRDGGTFILDSWILGLGVKYFF